MRKALTGILIFLLAILAYKTFTKDVDQGIVTAQSALIQEEVKKVGKLIVTEGYFSQVFDYKKSKSLFGNYVTADKKALVVVNAKVTVAYDLSKLMYEIDKKNKVLHIKNIPKEEFNIHPEIEYYDVQQDFFNPFKAEDYNAIRENVEKSLNEKIKASDLTKNAKQQLLSELSKFYILTKSMGWKLSYQENTIENIQEIKL